MKSTNFKIKDVFIDCNLFISKNKSMFLTSFIFIMIISLINNYMESTMLVSDLSNMSDNYAINPKEFTRVLFSLLPIFFLPSIFSKITRGHSQGRWKTISAILTPIKRFRFLMILLSTMTIIPMIVILAVLNFGSVIEKSIEYNTHITSNSSMIDRYAENAPDRSILDSETTISDIDRADLEKYYAFVDKTNTIASELNVEISKITNFDISVAAFLAVLIFSFYLNYSIVSSAMVTITDAGVLRSIIISSKSYFYNFKYVAILMTLWVAVVYALDFKIYELIPNFEQLHILTSIVKSIIITFFIFIISFILFRVVITNPKIVEIIDYDENNEKKFFSKFGRKIMINSDISLENFIIEKTRESVTKEDEDVNVKNKLRV